MSIAGPPQSGELVVRIKFDEGWRKKILDKNLLKLASQVRSYILKYLFFTNLSEDATIDKHYYLEIWA